MRNSIIAISFVLVFLFIGCDKQQVRDNLSKAIADKLTTSEVVAGLKEALINGISIGADLASNVDGYYKNGQIKIPVPPEIKTVEAVLEKIGLGNEVDKFIESLNRGAEQAAAKAKPIFINVITSMTFEDAWDILKGDVNGATEYLRKTTSAQLRKEFEPKIHESLQQVSATKYYSTIVKSYNMIPGVKDINPDIDDFVTERAIDGLFTLIANEEAKIREDPLARTTELLKRVFAEVD